MKEEAICDEATKLPRVMIQRLPRLENRAKDKKKGETKGRKA